MFPAIDMKNTTRNPIFLKNSTKYLIVSVKLLRDNEIIFKENLYFFMVTFICQARFLQHAMFPGAFAIFSLSHTNVQNDKTTLWLFAVSHEKESSLKINSLHGYCILYMDLIFYKQTVLCICKNTMVSSYQLQSLSFLLAGDIVAHLQQIGCTC